MQFGEKLVILREKHNMSQEELAEKLDVTRQTISNWENGKVAIDANKAVEICRLFDVDMNYLFLDLDKAASPAEIESCKSPKNSLGAKSRLILVVTCIVVTLALVVTLVFASICLSQSDNTVSSTITLSTQAGLIILIVACIVSILLAATVLLVTLLKRK